MKVLSQFLFSIVVLSTFLICSRCAEVSTPNEYSIIPMPEKLTKVDGQFKLTASSNIILDGSGEGMTYAANAFQNLITQSTGFNLEVKNGNEPEDGDIFLSLDNSIIGEEGYKLSVNKDQVIIKAKKPAGLFYGVQTLRQLMPAEIESKSKLDQPWKIAAVEIEDNPRFKYRGMHLDVARHFFPVDFVKEYIDLIAMHKMNTMHWHLTEDQGWRIEIKQYPKLTEIGAWRKETLIGHGGAKLEDMTFDGKRYGGFYTQDEVKEIVAYAKERFVTVIPEIEMPGHSLGALAAYPELGCTDGPFEVATRWGVFNDVYCPKEETFEFLENVLTEVFDLFPSKYVHIGGDECPKKAWEESAFCQDLIKKEGLKDEHELQSYFITRMEKFINSKGRAIIGWDEILEGGLAPNATVMSWRGIKGGIEAAKQGHDVIMTPGSHCYFDHYQTKDKENELLAIGGFTSVEKVYSYEPVPEELSAEEAKYILGAQANVWTEYIKTPEHAEYMVLPRMTALSEVVWSPKANRDWSDFTQRMDSQFKRFDELGLNYARHMIQP
ncbi:beta-N-acetylhexosaminidase [Reichenbachiella sp. MALMAid0571]|uniref:beta-N-acetylhexosaminidase n=1 Tax=Reichenbachiella sp. MALMAid0571 TaxID=3143939 RepID=UPI0032DEDAC3